MCVKAAMLGFVLACPVSGFAQGVYVTPLPDDAHKPVVEELKKMRFKIAEKSEIADVVVDLTDLKVQLGSTMVYSSARLREEEGLPRVIYSPFAKDEIDNDSDLYVDEKGEEDLVAYVDDISDRLLGILLAEPQYVNSEAEWNLRLYARRQVPTIAAALLKLMILVSDLSEDGRIRFDDKREAEIRNKLRDTEKH